MRIFSPAIYKNIDRTLPFVIYFDQSAIYLLCENNVLNIVRNKLDIAFMFEALITGKSKCVEIIIVKTWPSDSHARTF